MSSIFQTLPTGPFDIIVADPPWSYKNGVQSGSKSGYDFGAAAEYPTLSLSELKELKPQQEASKNCLLYLWATTPLLPEAIELAKAWGFTYKQAYIWNKAPQVNTGHYLLSSCELVLVCKRGTIPKGRASNPKREDGKGFLLFKQFIDAGKQVWEAVNVQCTSEFASKLIHETNTNLVINQKRGKHSRKPQDFYDIIELMWPTQTKLELFARKDRVGWKCWGDEI